MKKTSRLILLLTGLFILILVNSACTAFARTSVLPQETILTTGQPALPTSTLFTPTKTPLTPIIPITGENVVEMQCQFCVNDSTHAVFIFPDFAVFDVESSSPVTCMTAEVINGKRVLVCYGTQSTTFNLKICSDSSNCLLYPVALQACPLEGTLGTPITTGTPMTPVFLTAINTLRPPESTLVPAMAGPSSTPISGLSTPTEAGILTTPPPTVSIATTESPLSQPTATEPPPATTEPPPTSTPRPTRDHRDTKTPRP